MSKAFVRPHPVLRAIPTRSHANKTNDRRRHSSQAAIAKVEGPPLLAKSPTAHTHTARQRQADKEFFADLLSSAATKRDAKAYISRLKTVDKLDTHAAASQNVPPSSRSKLNSSPLLGRSTAVEASPVFSQGKVTKRQPLEELEQIHVALVKIAGLDTLNHDTVEGIAQTLGQLSRLRLAPIVVIDITEDPESQKWRRLAVEQADRLVAAIDTVSEAGARRMDDILGYSAENRPSLSLPNLLFRPLRQNRIPVLLPLAYSDASQQAVRVSANGAILALTEGLAPTTANKKPGQPTGQTRNRPQISLDRIIVIDPSGPIPSTRPTEDKHVFVNLNQEYHALQEELRSSSDPRVSPEHSSNLRMLRKALQTLPGTAAGLITTPQEAANSSQASQPDQISGVGTRRQKNPLIHNLLTDKPAYSSSLPSGRRGSFPHSASGSTFVKNGMPLTILPNPAAQAWTAEKQPWIKLTDSRIDLERLVYLINDSFDRKLDVEAYLKRVDDRIAGVIIAGEYEGGAIFTWETPPGVDEKDRSRLVPYLDKFAVLKRSQGAGGVADILFNAMVRTCFPDGVCWRSRKSNPVNKWYFERSRGTWKIPDMNWTMFWTTPAAAELDQTFLDYEAVCRGVQPTWADDKKIDD